MRYHASFCTAMSGPLRSARCCRKLQPQQAASFSELKAKSS